MQATQETTTAIAVEQLVKRYRRAQRNAVDGLSFQVRRGEIFGLLGPNGAGKTTVISMLTTSVLPTSGQIMLAGIDVTADPIGAKQRIAMVPQRNNLDRSLRIKEILTYHAAYHGVPRARRTARANALLEELGLSARKDEKLGWLSGGMEQRVMLARALMHEPEVLFLDEPTNNLDPQTRLFLWERIADLHKRGVTIILTTHDMEEADRLCERIAIMDRGRILAEGTPEGLKRLIPGGTMLELRVRIPATVIAGHVSSEEAASVLDDPFRATLEKLPGVTRVERLSTQTDETDKSQTAVFRLYASEDAGTLLASAAQTVIQEQGALLDLHFSQPSLEDVFIYLTGRNLRS
ncbi:MAG TPA: ABC transporter ATP-binding protein [Ktedonobacteraceae bacterium]|jgi:ABC-2 type transport system ATP-binding protein|nr:ABC transporter ATP-binding protein [Ktedonobacteraceae bacterium]